MPFGARGPLTVETARNEPVGGPPAIETGTGGTGAANRTPPRAPGGKPGVRREDWLLSQPPTFYTLQVMAVSDEGALVDYIGRHALGDDVSYFESRRGATPWYSLLYGLYEDRATALAALDALPQHLRKAGAWPRSLASIQEEIRKRE